METIYQDVRYGWRMLRKSPGFALVIVLMLALGIGANTAVFTVLSDALLRPLPFEKPEQLGQLWETRTSGAFQRMGASYLDFVDMRNNQVFAQRGGYSRTTMTLSQPSGAVQVTVAMASTRFFETLGVHPVLGRGYVLRLILNHGVRLALIGAALGVAGAVAAGQVIASLLFAVTPTDATTFAGVCLAHDLGTPGQLCPHVSRDQGRSHGGSALRVRR